jgi:Zn-finger nucleic acid-binding protein
MRSPIHTDIYLQRVELEPGLEAFQCPKSRGYWIPLQAYTTWQDRHRDRIRPLPAGYEPHFEENAYQRTLICPESGCVLLRYRVGQGLNFRIDRSAKTGGVWLDAGEWEALKDKNLHDELHLIFGAPYQRRIRTDESHAQLRQLFAQRIGSADFVRVNEFRHWLHQHPRQREILAYLLDENGTDSLR